jgi:hypothetical protein
LFPIVGRTIARSAVEQLKVDGKLKMTGGDGLRIRIADRSGWARVGRMLCCCDNRKYDGCAQRDGKSYKDNPKSHGAFPEIFSFAALVPNVAALDSGQSVAHFAIRMTSIKQRDSSSESHDQIALMIIRSLSGHPTHRSTQSGLYRKT